WLLRQAQRARLERGAHGKGLVAIDGTPRLSAICFARRRLGCLRGNRNGATETDRLARDSSQLSAGHSQPDSEIAFAERKARACGDGWLSRKRIGLLRDSIDASTGRWLCACGFA